MKESGLKNARYELRLTREEKDLIERASRLAGFHTLSSFILSVVKEYAGKIINEKERILASQQDKEIFFEAVFSGNEPNENLKKAAGEYFAKQGEE